MKNFCKYICTLSIPVTNAHGTIGSLIGLLIVLIIRPFGILFSTIIFLLITAIGFVSLMQYDPKSDEKEIIIDEVVGQMLSLYIGQLMIYYLSGISMEINGMLYVTFAVLNFIIFRFFDIIKPLAITYIDSNVKNCYGIMLDDALAALYSGIVSATFVIMFAYVL